MDTASDDLLDGLEGDAREARRELLDELRAQGVPAEELRAAVAEDRLVLLPIERALVGPARWTAREVAERAGIDLDTFLAMRIAFGMSAPDPDAVAYGERDLEATQRLKVYLDAGIPLDELLGTLRVIGDHMAPIAQTMRSMFARAFMEAGDSEAALGHRFAEMTEVLMPLVGPDLEYGLRLHLREFTRHDAIRMSERVAGRVSSTQQVAIAFADLVGFTRLGEELGVEELGEVAARLTGIARELVQPPVRIVKTIGDAVMLVSAEPQAMVDTVLALLAAVEAADDLPPLRAGITWGAAVARFSDWYGGTVNVASRLAERARAGAVLTTTDLKEALGDAAEGYVWSFAGEKHFKNLSAAVPTWRLRRSADAD